MKQKNICDSPHDILRNRDILREISGMSHAFDVSCEIFKIRLLTSP
jgi:hypothetical protein